MFENSKFSSLNCSISYKILNICLIPQQENKTHEGIDFNQTVIAISKELNNVNVSDYELTDNVTNADEKYSLPHCTVVHMRVPNNPETIQFLSEKLDPFIGISLKVEVDGVATIEGSAFSREEIIKKGTSKLPVNIQWISVVKSTELMELQEQVIKATSEVQNILLITGQKEQYDPHFTLWVKNKNNGPIAIKQQEIADKYSKQFFHSFINCKVVFGDCGPIGQVKNTYY